MTVYLAEANLIGADAHLLLRQVTDKTIITAVVIIPFVVSAGFALVAVCALRPAEITRYNYMHHSFSSTFIGFIYIPGFIIIITLIIYFIHLGSLVECLPLTDIRY